MSETGRIRVIRPKCGTRALGPEEQVRTRKRWDTEPPLATLLPIQFETGGSLTSLSGSCPNCQTEVPSEDLRGVITRPTGGSAIIDGIGLCPKCRIWVPFYFISKDAPVRLEWMDEGTNAWMMAVGKPELGRWRRALLWLWHALTFQGV